MGEHSNNIPDLRRKALEDALESYRKDYQEQCVMFSELDRKAQATTAIAGIFLAAVLAFAKIDELVRLLNLLGVTGLLFLGLTIIMLIFVVGASIWATAIRSCPLSPDPDLLSDWTNDVLGLPPNNILPIHFENLLSQEILLWKPIVKSLIEINRGKSHTIVAAQIVLSLAITAVALLLLIIISASFVHCK